jgi:UDP-GlcNAc:undecaprenyl-phosphate GlcNAc-1-phosphate transferase
MVVVLSLTLSGVALAFLRYNFPPAKILMGDSGSLFLGLIFGITSVLMLVPGKDLFFRAAGGVIILSIPLLDTVLAFTRRLVTGSPVFKADLKHIHHILLYRFKSVLKVDLALWSLSVVFGLLGIMTMMGNIAALSCAVVIQAIVFIAGLRSMVRFDVPGEAVEKILHKNGIDAVRL